MLLNLFPVWVLCAAIAGFTFPETLSAQRDSVVPLLIGVMLCMGLTLTVQDFWGVIKYRWAVFTGVFLQFTIMPMMAFFISIALEFDTHLTIGMVILGSVAGGTASNVMTLLAGGNVALSVSMTALSTLLGVVMTPLLLLWWVGSTVTVPAGGMLINLFKIVVLPVALGVFLNHFFSSKVRKISYLLAPTSMMLIVLIIGIVVALNAGRIGSGALIVVFATLLHNLSGLSFGYLAARLLGFDSVVCRTIAIEVGMQNSGLATVLALKFFTPLASLPGAVFSIWLDLKGSVFAFFCRRADGQDTQQS